MTGSWEQCTESVAFMKCWEFPAELRNSLASQEKTLPAGVGVM